MLTKEDKNWMVENFVTRSEYRTDADAVKESISDLSTKVDRVLVQLDKFTGTVKTLQQENAMGAVTLRRHDIQIHELAEATGTKISE
ncbi:hypothetical protein HYV30_01775 [Candidatus Kaiserbacteria bacterium]|nr:hypothetical protein [Candidatus Kaiserbacteria bacterium]